ncbi:MAG: hypothetical protein ABMA13_17195 [Chthoniobacteraceae bacterium]
MDAPNPSPSQRRRRLWARLFASKFLLVSIVVHLLFGVGATYLIVQRVAAKRRVTFQAGPPSVNPSQRALEHKVTMAQKKKSGGAPPQAKRIVTAGLANISLPEMPAIPSASNVTPGMMAGMGGVGFGQGIGMGSGMGSGAGSGGAGMTLFGFRGGGDGLIGTFYDLKQTRDRKPTDMAAEPGEGLDLQGPKAMRYKEVVSHFVKGSWSTSQLDRYFKAPRQVALTQLFIPQLLAEEAPKAFQVEKECEGRRWLVHYRGQIIAPRTGTFRFVGSADDILIVRCKGRNVLDASLGLYRVLPEANEADNVGSAPIVPMVAGRWIEMRQGEPMPVEALIGENPGGHFSCFLMIEERGAAHPDGVFPVFQLRAMDIPTGIAPQHAGSIIFTARKPGTGSLLDALKSR